jgi:hypothetical protein
METIPLLMIEKMRQKCHIVPLVFFYPILSRQGQKDKIEREKQRSG